MTPKFAEVNMLTVKVTEEDIKEGSWKNCLRCPVARAIKRAISNKLVVLVNNTMVEFYDAGTLNKKRTTILPDEAVMFISTFDTYKVGKPFEFKLNITEEELEALTK